MTETENKEFVKQLKTVESSLSNYARGLCKDIYEAQDLVQDTIMYCFLNYEKILDKQAFIAYIFRIANRTYFKAKWRKRLFVRLDEVQAEQITDTGMQVERKMELDELHEAMQNLKPVYREAISLHVFAGLPLKDIADIQKTNMNTVKTRLRRGRAKLAELLEVEDTVKSQTKKSNQFFSIPKEQLL